MPQRRRRRCAQRLFRWLLACGCWAGYYIMAGAGDWRTSQVSAGIRSPPAARRRRPSPGAPPPPPSAAGEAATGAAGRRTGCSRAAPLMQASSSPAPAGAGARTTARLAAAAASATAALPLDGGPHHPAVGRLDELLWPLLRWEASGHSITSNERTGRTKQATCKRATARPNQLEPQPPACAHVVGATGTEPDTPAPPRTAGPAHVELEHHARTARPSPTRSFGRLASNAARSGLRAPVSGLVDVDPPKSWRGGRPPKCEPRIGNAQTASLRSRAPFAKLDPFELDPFAGSVSSGLASMSRIALHFGGEPSKEKRLIYRPRAGSGVGGPNVRGGGGWRGTCFAAVSEWSKESDSSSDVFARMGSNPIGRIRKLTFFFLALLTPGYQLHQATVPHMNRRSA
ncbi:hypothetical protein T492DRAFT_1142651 [Pavlovales sp. CCMP2436]|nr:hypothetical protein T492DRAFT_1142651 [Pavlovales sp. CCMP2436]